MKSVFVITRLTLLEAARRRILLAAFVLGVVFLALFSLGFHFMSLTVQSVQDTIVSRQMAFGEFYNFVLMAGLYAISFLSIAMGAMLAADTLAGEIGSGTIQSIVAKPIRRFEIVLGKWLGFSVLLGAYLAVMVGGVVGSVWLQTGYLPPNLLPGLSLMYLECVLMMTLTLASSSTLSTLATGGVVFGLFGIAFLGGWVEQLGSFASNPTAVQVGIVSSLIIPSEALWKRAAYEMTSPFVRALGFSPFSSPSVPSTAMVVYAVAYLVVCLLMAIRQFSRRDL